MRLNLRLDRSKLAAAHDIVMAAVSFVAALYLRLGPDTLPQTEGFLLEGTALFTAIAALVFVGTGLYRGVWRYASLPDLVGLLKAVTLAHLVFLVALFLLTRLELYPRSALVINWFVLVALLGGPRFLYRLVKDGSLARVFERAHAARVPVLVAGAGDEAEAFIRAMAREADAPYDVVGLLSRDAAEVGRRIRGVEVIGVVPDVAGALTRLARRGPRPRRLILAGEGFGAEDVQALLAGAEAAGLGLARLGRLTDFRAGAAPAFELKPVSIEDLLGRPQTVLDRAAMARLVAGRRVLITGGGGTIGTELARQVAALGPARLVLLDHAEFALYGVDAMLARDFATVERAAILADVRDPRPLMRAFSLHRPDLVFHAAALKHVPIAEAHAAEAALTNAIGTRNAAAAARASGVETFVLISTDKAVNPAGVMGRTKRLAELAVGAEAASGGRTRFVTVRFGNVLGSTGSVVPLFQAQLAGGGPLTVTDARAQRYFMTAREAVELVLQASALPAPEGAILVLEMGQPVAITDLARQMIRLSGKHAAIVFTGLRPGEKLTEELFHAEERRVATAQGAIAVALPPAVDGAAVARRLSEIETAARAADDARVRALLSAPVGVATLSPKVSHG
jgi:O-antigen biosynthesis protein WbqV